MHVTRISPRESAEKMGAGWLYVDVRPDDEFAEGRPAGAVNVPYTRNVERFVESVRAVAGDCRRVIVGCKSGIVSLSAAEMLAEAGFEVVEQRAGFDGSRGTFGQLEEPGWARENLPVERDEDA